MDIKSNKDNLEPGSESAGSGFDTKGSFLKKAMGGGVPQIVGKPVGTLLKICLIVLLAVGGYFWFQYGFAPVRNCIGSLDFVGSTSKGAPECSDCTRNLMETRVNGRSLGKCTANPGTGGYDDQCTLNCPGR